MNKLCKRGIFVLLCLFILVAGVTAGVFLYKAQYQKTVAFRVSDSKEEMDYDFLAALSYLKHRFEENGYRVLGISYAGELYPQELNDAFVNVYVRGFKPFYDLRQKEEADNVYYIHRIVEIHREEIRRYGYYLSSQKGITQYLNNGSKFAFLEGGAVPHEKLKPFYDKDVLYIYEYGNLNYLMFLNKYLNAKVYGGGAFARLSEEEKKKELSGARLVVYEMGNANLDDEDYVPYAVYDIISYGRPVLTNYKKPLEREFFENVHLFDGRDEMFEATVKAFGISDSEREQRAQNARRKLLTRKNENGFFLKK